LRLPGLIFGTPRAKPCHQAAGETSIAASPNRRPEEVRRAGLEVVEKPLTTNILKANRTALRAVKR